MPDKANPEDKKTMDVSKPGKSAPDSSARPVIISHRPMVQDPMVKADVPSAVEPAVPEEEKPVTHGAKIIQPISITTTPETPVKAKESVVDQPVVEEQKPTEGSEVPKEEEKPAPTESVTDESESSEAIVDAVAGQADIVSKKKQNELTEAEKAKKEALQKLITDKKYFLPVGQQQHRKNKRTAILGVLLIILLALGGAYVLIDAGFVKVPFSLPINLINN